MNVYKTIEEIIIRIRALIDFSSFYSFNRFSIRNLDRMAPGAAPRAAPGAGDRR